MEEHDLDEARAFIQRSEVRMSTLHRTATALLSGAGVLVLLPALGRDAVVNVLRTLLEAEFTAPDVLLVAAVGTVLASIIIVIWMLLTELTRFFFHSNHLSTDAGSMFTPRFTLTTIKLSSERLSDGFREAIATERSAPHNRELLVPPNGRARSRIDQQIGTYFGGNPDADDEYRAAALMALAGARDRSIAGEVAKIEYGVARHVLRLQVIVMRYMKALFVVILSLLLVFSLAAVSEDRHGLDVPSQAWAIALLLAWSPGVQFAVASPMRWLGDLLVHDGATRANIKYDREFTFLERAMSRLTSTVTVLAATAGLLLLRRHPGEVDRAAVFAIVGGILAQAGVLWQERFTRRH